jgi:hypothetical protein
MPEYEVFEPDPKDEYYDQACSAAYARMFNERSDVNERSHHADDPFVVCTLSHC